MPRRRSDDSQTLRALLEMRELLVRGEFRAGERIREIPLAARLRMSRTPLRTVLGRLEQEGLVAARPTGGYVAAEFSVHDIRDGIEVRGALEGLAAKLAAERSPRSEDLTDIRKVLAATDRLLQRWTSGTDSLARYIVLNAAFHAQIVDLAKSPMVRRAIDRAVALPFASPNAFLIGHALKKEGREIVTLSQVHHRAIVDAIASREPGRAESLAREHSRLARTSLELVLNRQLLSSVPGASLIRFPDPAELDASRPA
ncbi:MAG TPA: GntR family transcriptional regulator [Vicinamibacterales bacterium]|nr:GntR family transcriptional regulator [Vicinamibacterales bacterium]